MDPSNDELYEALKGIKFDVFVVDETRLENVAVFQTVKEAEDFIAALPNKADVYSGRYGIDAPEGKVNP